MAYGRYGRGGYPEQRNRVNGGITGVSACILIDENGEKMGMFGIDAAKRIARERGLDLVEMTSDERPVCRIMNYGKFKYEQGKKEKARKRAQAQVSAVRQMKFRPKIGESDYNHKKAKVEEFLADGDKVRVVIMFRGREISHPEIGMSILDRLANEVSGVGKVVNPPRVEGRNMTMLLAPLPVDLRKQKAAAETKQPEDDAE